MSRFGRRTFLASSAGVAASVSGGRGDADSRRPPRPKPPKDTYVSLTPWRAHPARCALVDSPRTARSTPSASTPTTARWPGRCRLTGVTVTQTAYRIVVRRTDPTRGGIVWDSGPVLSARQAFVAYKGPPWPPTRRTSGPSNPAGTPTRWAGIGPVAVHHGTAPE